MRVRTNIQRSVRALLFLGMFISLLQALGGVAMLLLIRPKVGSSVMDESQNYSISLFQYLLINGSVFFVILAALYFLFLKTMRLENLSENVPPRGSW